MKQDNQLFFIVIATIIVLFSTIFGFVLVEEALDEADKPTINLIISVINKCELRQVREFVFECKTDNHEIVIHIKHQRIGKLVLYGKKNRHITFNLEQQVFKQSEKLKELIKKDHQ
jgi:hypothetical protein